MTKLKTFTAKELIDYCDYVEDVIRELSLAYQNIERNEKKSGKFDAELISDVKQQIYNQAKRLFDSITKRDKGRSKEEVDAQFLGYMNGTYDISLQDIYDWYLEDEEV